MRKLFSSKNLKKYKVFTLGLIASVGVSAQQLTVNLTPSNVNCQGLKNGQVTANVTGGIPPYQYKWSNGASTQSISNLNPGYFHCTVVDNNNIMGEAEITLTEPEILRIVQYDATIYSNNFNTSCYSCNDGAITVSVAGGTPPYYYLWSDGSTQQNRANLVAKDYQLVVTDAFGCQVRELNKELSKPERDDWTANGNNNANSNSFIGTTNNFPLVFKANNNEGFRLLTDGKFGIGTTTPTAKLDINGNARIRGINSNYGGIPFTTGETRLVSTDADGNLRDEYVDVRSGTNCTKMVLGWSARPLLDLSMAYTNSNGITVYPQDLTNPNDIIKCPQLGNVGIGVLQPNYKVDVDGDVNASGFRLNGNPVIFSQWSNTNGLTYTGNLVNITDAGNTLTFKAHNPNGEISSSTNKIDFWTSPGTWNDIACGKITANGDLTVNGTCLFNSDMKFAYKVVIGSTNIQTDAKLAVAGNIKAHEITVDNTWSDFVFDDNYKLTPLLDVEKFLIKNNHLEGIPSASEIEKNGLPLGELVKLQMQKIEELTLYTIELQKQLNELKMNIKK